MKQVAAFTGNVLPLQTVRNGATRCCSNVPRMSASSSRPVVLAPGQGAQTAGMGLAWASTNASAQALLDEADAILEGKLPGRLSDLMREGGSTLDRTDVAQPALFVAGAMALAGSEIETPIAASGLSLGEYTALYAAGALSFEDGVRLVAARGAAMQAAATASAGGMVALLGVDEEKARAIAAATAQGEVLVASNFNSPGQVVLSGAKDAVARAADAAKADGLRAAVLDVAGAFHSPFMQPAADTLAAELAKTSFQPLQCTVVSNVTGEPFTDGSIPELLARGLTSEVRWEKCVRYLLNEVNGSEFVELAPGKTLAGMTRKIDRKTKVRSLDAPVPATAA